MCKTKLTQKINSVNKRYLAGLNDDDQVFRMVEEDKKTKGWSFYPEYDSYILITDQDKIQRLVNKYGYWSEAIKTFNNTLTLKGGYNYMELLNSKYIGTKNTKL